MNRTDRLLAIVLELQGKGTQRAEDLAGTFEISKRTVYRDIQALCEAGVPIVAEPGRGYSLVEGYFLPPLRFSPDEAIMLLLGCDVMAQNFDAEYRAAAQAASRKIAGVLPAASRDVVADLQASIRFVTASDRASGDEATRLQQLRRAIGQRRVIRFHYYSRHADDHAPVERTAEPLGLAHMNTAWHVVAFDRLRQAMRHFRVDRMDHLHVLAQTFTRPPDFAMQAYMPEDRRAVMIRVLFDHAVARWVREARNFFVQDMQDHPEGLLVTLRVNHEQEIVQWLLSWGRHVRVLEPTSLREHLCAEAAAMLHNFQES